MTPEHTDTQTDHEAGKKAKWLLCDERTFLAFDNTLHDFAQPETDPLPESRLD